MPCGNIQQALTFDRGGTVTFDQRDTHRVRAEVFGQCGRVTDRHHLCPRGGAADRGFELGADLGLVDLPAHQRLEGLPIAPDVQVQVLHIVQEALSNIRKHAHARQVEVRVDTHPQWQVTIRDDGLGFDARGGPPDGTHVGLRIMRERAERIGAHLTLESGHQGTCVTLRLPQNPQPAAAQTHEAPVT